MTSFIIFLFAIVIIAVTGFLAQAAITVAWFWYSFDSEPSTQDSPEGVGDGGEESP